MILFSCHFIEFPEQKPGVLDLARISNAYYKGGARQRLRSKSKRAKVMDKLTILTNHLQLLAELAADLQEQIASAQDGAKEKSLNQIMGSLYGLSTTAEHIQNIYETMLLVHRK